MQLSLVVLGLAALVSGCEKTCKSGTVLVEIKLSGGPLAATTIELDLQIGDDNPTAQPVTHTPDVASGTVEVQFPRGYPKGQTLTIGGRALLGPAVLGTGATSVKLGDECERVTIEITGEVVDLAGLDLSSGDMAFKVVKHGDRCDGVSTICFGADVCVDGVCCSSACTGQCEACNVPGSEGTCTQIVGTPVGRPACTTDGVCGGSCVDGKRDACTYDNSVSCRPASCTADVATAAATCQDGTCPAPVTTTCSAINKTCGASGCTNIVQLSAGYDDTCAVLEDTTVRCWGEGGYGQMGLGAGNTDSSAVPTTVSNLKDVTKVSMGRDNNGAVCALQGLLGKVKCWGGNFYGDLGRGAFDNMPHGDPQPMLASAGVELTGVSDIGLGKLTTCLITSGAVKCLGATYWGVAGNAAGSDQKVLFPVGVLGATSGFTEVYAGGEHACAVNGATNSSSLYCWGSNGFYQLGNTGGTNTTATSVSGMASSTNATLLKAAETTLGDVSCAIDNTSLVRCWGSNAFGKLGRNIASTTLSRSEVPTPICLDTTCSGVGHVFNTGISVCGGDFHLCAVRSTNSKVYCWGRGNSGQLGDGNGATHDLLMPTAVTLPAGASNPVEVTCGGYHTCARTATNQVYCWGWNASGQLGNNMSGTDSAVPVQVAWP